MQLECNFVQDPCIPEPCLPVLCKGMLVDHAVPGWVGSHHMLFPCTDRGSGSTAVSMAQMAASVWYGWYGGDVHFAGGFVEGFTWGLPHACPPTRTLVALRDVGSVLNGPSPAC